MAAESSPRRPGLELRSVSVNGQPGLIARYGGQAVVVTFVVHEGRITHIDLMANPVKLARIAQSG